MSLEQVTNADQPATDDEAMLVRVQREDFSIDEELKRVRRRSKRIGGIAMFLGTARDRSKGKDVDGITFEHYEGMAQKKLREIRERAIKDFGVIEVLVLHRYGEITIGENIVLIIAAAEHRAEAFRACQWAMETRAHPRRRGVGRGAPIAPVRGEQSGGRGPRLRVTMDHRTLDTPAPTIFDRLGRPLRSLRLSVTDRCNLRCKYCMPEDDYAWLPRDTILTFEEMAELTAIFTELGVDKVRLTGGEPLLRRDLPRFVRQLSENRRITEIALTSNGVLMADQAADLSFAGLNRVTISLDTLRADRFRTLTKRDLHHQVFDGIKAVVQAGFPSLKFDTVIIKGYNDDELIDLIEYGKTVGGEVRFIEYMDVGGATDWSMNQVLSRAEMLEHIGRHYGEVTPIVENSVAPAERFRLPDGTSFGIIPSTTTPFCRSCDRSRLTADGMWYLCLYAKDGLDLRAPLRQGRKALEVLCLREQRLIEINRLREDPHLEMHARGG